MVQATPKIAPQQIALALRQIIQSVYRDGVDAVMSYEMSDNGDIKGVFRDSRQLYDYTITDEGEISYVERDSKRGDSYLEGYYLTEYVPLNGTSTPYTKGAIDSQLKRLDALKQKQCSVGKSCGNACIAKGVRCTQALGVRQQEALKNIKSAIPKSPQGKSPNYTVGALLAAGALTGVGLAAIDIHQREGLKNQYERQGQKSIKKISKLEDKVEKYKKQVKNTKPISKPQQPPFASKAIAPKRLGNAEVSSASSQPAAAQSKREEPAFKSQIVLSRGGKLSNPTRSALNETQQDESINAAVESELNQAQKLLPPSRSTKALLSINSKSKDIDLGATISNLHPDNVKDLGKLFKAHIASRLHQEHQKGIDDIASDAFRAMEKSKLNLSPIDRKKARSRIRTQTAHRLQAFNKEFYGVAKRNLSNAKSNFETFESEYRDAAKTGKAMGSDRIRSYSKAFSTYNLTKALTDASVRIRNKYPLNPKRTNKRLFPEDAIKGYDKPASTDFPEDAIKFFDAPADGLSEQKARQIIRATNKLIQNRSTARFKRPIREDSAACVELVKKLIAIAAW